jgi:hypothetical protein
MKKCKICYGYGLHALGENNPVGPLDAVDGYPTIKCPECGANENPQNGDKLGNSFIEFMEEMGAKFIDVTPKNKD